MGQLEQNFKTASLELIEIRSQRQEFDHDTNQHNQAYEQIAQEVNEMD
jgi:hypothetical protein